MHVDAIQDHWGKSISALCNVKCKCMPELALLHCHAVHHGCCCSLPYCAYLLMLCSQPCRVSFHYIITRCSMPCCAESPMQACFIALRCQLCCSVKCCSMPRCTDLPVTTCATALHSHPSLQHQADELSIAHCEPKAIHVMLADASLATVWSHSSLGHLRLTGGLWRPEQQHTVPSRCTHFVPQHRLLV